MIQYHIRVTGRSTSIFSVSGVTPLVQQKLNINPLISPAPWLGGILAHSSVQNW